MYAIIEESGKQYKVTSGDTILIDRQGSPDEKTVTFDRILLVGGEGQPKIGEPLVVGATVSADVMGPEKGKKLDIFKYNRRKGYHKKQGHRQKLTVIKVKEITA